VALGADSAVIDGEETSTSMEMALPFSATPLRVLTSQSRTGTIIVRGGCRGTPRGRTHCATSLTLAMVTASMRTTQGRPLIPQMKRAPQLPL
jgi:hypothetical protein